MSILLDIWYHLTKHTHNGSKEEILDAMALEYQKSTGETVDWRKSVVDRMKVLKIDEAQTSFKERKKLAVYYEIPDYTGTAEQNAKLADALTDDLIG